MAQESPVNIRHQEWEHRKKFHDLSDEEVMSPTDLSAHEERRMKHNAAPMIDGIVAPNGYTLELKFTFSAIQMHQMVKNIIFR